MQLSLRIKVDNLYERYENVSDYISDQIDVLTGKVNGIIYDMRESKAE